MNQNRVHDEIKEIIGLHSGKVNEYSIKSYFPPLKFEVLTAITIKITVFWGVTSSIMKFAGVGSAQIKLNFHETKRHYIPEGSNLYIHLESIKTLQTCVL
jgi:hypothetical protein